MTSPDTAVVMAGPTNVAATARLLAAFPTSNTDDVAAPEYSITHADATDPVLNVMTIDVPVPQFAKYQMSVDNVNVVFEA
jgi:hypothetical protein